MNKALHRMVVTSCCLLIAAAATSCVGSADGGENPVPVVENVPGEIDDAVASRAMQTALAHPDEHVLEGLPQIDAEELLGSEKIRNGNAIGYNNIVGNGVVFIGTAVPGGIQLCSAQVINTWFLLTAAHCVAELLPSGTGTLAVAFTNSVGTRVSVYSNTAYGFMQPNPRLVDRDTGLIFLPFGLTTCQGTLSECSSSSPNVPENASFQYFKTSAPVTTVGNYLITGYGGTDDMLSGVGVLRVGTMAVTHAGFTPTDLQGFSFVLNWTAEGQQRPCKVDSGSPLVASASNRLLYTSIASGTLTAGGCNAMSGSVAYSGLSEYQASWVLSALFQFKDTFRLPFHCAIASSFNIFAWVCDNDGKVF